MTRTTVKELMENKDFMEKAIAIKDSDEIENLFRENGVDAPMEEIAEELKDYAQSLNLETDELDASALEAVSGGRNNPVGEFIMQIIAVMYNCTIGVPTNTRITR